MKPSVPDGGYCQGWSELCEYLSELAWLRHLIAAIALLAVEIVLLILAIAVTQIRSWRVLIPNGVHLEHVRAGL